jgi:3',5'-cyclic AMP phosphodiesterase CpdA
VQRTIAHISDLHLGRDRRTDAEVAALATALLQARVDTVLLTGDVTHRGRRAEHATFEHLFAPLRDRLVVVPGNHDRLGEDAGTLLMPGGRVAVASRPGLHVVRLDSTAPHNRTLIDSHGQLTPGDQEAVVAAVAAAPTGALVALMLHHHLLPLPADHLGEKLATWLGWPSADELELGADLLEALRGRCDLVVHGHRHAERTWVLPARAGRPLRIHNAGSTPELGRARILAHAGGRIVSERWLAVPRPGVPGRAVAVRARPDERPASAAA